jgi:hypothetical protein
MVALPKTEGEDPKIKNGKGANASFFRGNPTQMGTQLPNPKRTDVEALSLLSFVYVERCEKMLMLCWPSTIPTEVLVDNFPASSNSSAAAACNLPTV